MDVSSELKKQNSRELAVGFDLTDTYSQVSFGFLDSENVETVSTVAGASNYLIPTALFKRREVNQWYAGKDAVKNAEEDGFFVDKLISKAILKEEVSVGDETFRPSALIALFMKRTLSLLNVVAPISKITSFMVTVDALDENMVNVLTEAVLSLGLKTENIFFQSHMESFYYYTIFQDKELWLHDVLLMDFSGDVLKSYRMECNNNTTPIVAFIDPMTFTNVKIENAGDFLADSLEAKSLDNDISQVVTDLCNSRIFSSIYFIGENFRQDLFPESVKMMCKKGRVFEGNNLYSKGAAYAARNKIRSSILSESHVFLGNDKLKSNVGINVLKHGEPSYLALLNAGVNWFEAKKECDVIMNLGNKLSFVITPLTGKNPEVVDITLSDLPKRPSRCSRLHVEVSMISEAKMQVTVKDLGFGELFPSSNIEWKEVVNV